MNSDGIDLAQGKGDGLVLKIILVCYPDELLTPLLLSYTDVVQDPSLRSTLGFVISNKQIEVDTTLIKLLLVDLSTGPHFDSRLSSYFGGSSAAVFAFSKNNHSYLDSIKDSYREFWEWRGHPALSIAFIGLHSDPEVVNTSEGQEVAKELGVDYYEMAIDDLQTLDVVLRSLSRKFLEKQEG